MRNMRKTPKIRFLPLPLRPFWRHYPRKMTKNCWNLRFNQFWPKMRPLEMPPRQLWCNLPHLTIPGSILPNLFAVLQTAMIMDYYTQSMTAAMLLLPPLFVTNHSALLRKLRGLHDQVIFHDRHPLANSFDITHL